jgi:hypothetical protein
MMKENKDAIVLDFYCHNSVFDFILIERGLKMQNTNEPLQARLAKELSDAVECRERAAKHELHHSVIYTDGYIRALKRVLQWIEAQALNAPVRATEAVLVGLVDGVHEFEVAPCGTPPQWVPSYFCNNDMVWNYDIPNHFNGFYVNDCEVIRATNASAIEYLLQFTAEGVKKDER